jgi:hypothetical protein
MFWSFVNTSHNPKFNNNHYFSNTNHFDKDKVFENFHAIKEYALENNLDVDVKINTNIKVAVVSQSYYRKNGTSRKNILNVFKMLENQKYQNFKLFMIGDNYNPNEWDNEELKKEELKKEELKKEELKEEFNEMCKLYTGDIFYENNPYSCRELKMVDFRNYWTTGGILACKKGYEKAKEEGFDIVLMLDDDDIWLEDHVQNVIWGFTNYPDAAFIVTQAKYCYNRHLPKTGISEVYYNNYIVRGSDSVRSASAHNLKYLFEDQMSVIEQTETKLKAIHKNNTDKEGSDRSRITACDATLLKIIGNNVDNGKYKMIYLPWTTVIKETNGNNPMR